MTIIARGSATSNPDPSSGFGMAGWYTVFGDPLVDRRIECDLDVIREHILTTYRRAGVQGIVLVGGFGRGEGGVLFENGAIIPQNDYDLVIITQRKIDPTELQRSRSHLAEVLGIPWVDLVNYSRKRLRGLPLTLFNFDLIEAGTVVYGDQEVLASAPRWMAKEIPIWEAETLLFTRLWCFLGATRLGFGYRDLSPDAGFFFLQQMAKAVLAFQDVQLLSTGLYHPSYQRRSALFEERFPELAAAFPLIRAAREMKLRPAKPGDECSELVQFERIRDLFLTSFWTIGSSLYGKSIGGAFEYENAYFRCWRNRLLRLKGRLRGNPYQLRTQAINLAQLHLLASHRFALERQRDKSSRTHPSIARAMRWIEIFGPQASEREEWDSQREIAVELRMKA